MTFVAILLGLSVTRRPCCLRWFISDRAIVRICGFYWFISDRKGQFHWFISDRSIGLSVTETGLQPSVYQALRNRNARARFFNFIIF